MVEPSSAPLPFGTPGWIAQRVLYRDADLIVLDKPAGLPVHRGPGGGPNLEDFLDELRFGFERLPALGHRLDRDTSGCLILGRHAKALARLGKLFAGGLVEKSYRAIVAGTPAAPQGRVELALTKQAQPQGGWRMVGDPAKGRAAVTDWLVERAAGGRALVTCHPRTGRTHQLRVHLASIGCPILGDRFYAPPEARSAAPRLMLHAAAIALTLKPGRETLRIEAPLPGDMTMLAKAAGLL